jgi:cyclopropane-fatty-acyl-phospholipid synthase
LSSTAIRLKKFTENVFFEFPWELIIKDWEGNAYSLGLKTKHWRNEPLVFHIKTEAAAKDVLSLNVMRFLERFLDGDVDMEGNLYLLPLLRTNAKLSLPAWDTFLLLVSNLSRTFLFQDVSRARANVKSHYDIPQEALNVYLDRVYMSYSCGMFENPERLDVEELTRIGKGKEDKFDSLEKAQWRKFKDAVDFINPKEGETLLDIGCGYSGQLTVALENHPFGKVVGWTHSKNQFLEGRKMLSQFDSTRWELNEGDYRQDNRVFDHITSTGMFCHVGPRGLVPYVQNVRKRIKKGGRYMHHGMMNPYSKIPLDSEIGVAFQKKYVWPGFHWFTLNEHIKALEENGFRVLKAVNLTRHYEKTTAAWNERMMANKETMVKNLGEATFRAWRVYLAGISGSFSENGTLIYRVYCEAV